MVKVGDIVISGTQEAFMVPKGTLVSIANPEWNEDCLETQLNLLIELDQDFYVWTTGCNERISGKIVEIKPVV